MTRIFTDGAELGDILFWDYINGISNQTSVVRSGSRAYQLGGGGSARKMFSDVTEFYARFAYYRPGLSGGSLYGWQKDVTQIGMVSIDDGYIPNIQVGTTVIASGVHSYAENAWHLVEVHVKISDTVGIITVYFDGNKEIDYSGDTKPGAETTINNIKIWSDTYYDDLAFNDTNGTFDNSWCGDGHIVMIIPSGSGTTNNWLNSGSTSGSSNYTYVREYPNDGDTTYIYVSGSNTGLQDQYKMTSFSGAGKTITRIYIEGTARKTKADAVTVKFGYLPSGGTDQMSGSLLLSTNYVKVVGTSASWNPVTSASWTAADINALEAIIEI